MDLHGDALSKISGDMDDMESNKYKGGGATITITVSPGADSSDEGGAMGAGDLPADSVPMAGGGEVATTAEQLDADHDALECKGECPAHKGFKSGALGDEDMDAITMAAGGQVPMAPAPTETDDLRVPPFLRKKKMV
jgi:hypothetical protein